MSTGAESERDVMDEPAGRVAQSDVVMVPIIYRCACCSSSVYLDGKRTPPQSHYRGR